MKSFATSICPIKKSSRSEYEALGGSPAPSPRHPRAIPASSQRGETITQPISKRFLSGVITGLRHGDPLTTTPEAIPAEAIPTGAIPSGAIPAEAIPTEAIPAGAEMHILRIILACLLARWYICDRITSGQGENPDRRYSPRAERHEPLKLRYRQCSRYFPDKSG